MSQSGDDDENIIDPFALDFVVSKAYDRRIA
jgi:hypothetical protein